MNSSFLGCEAMQMKWHFCTNHIENTIITRFAGKAG